MLYSEFTYTRQKDFDDRVAQVSPEQVGSKTGYENWPGTTGMLEPEGEGVVSCGGGSNYPMFCFEELCSDEDVCYLDHDMGIDDWKALTGT